MTDFSLLVKRLRAKSPEECRADLIRSGIIDGDLELADHYCTKQQLNDKRKRRRLKAGENMYVVKVNDKFARFASYCNVALVDKPEEATLYKRLSDAQRRQKQARGRLGLYTGCTKLDNPEVQIFEVDFQSTLKWVDG